MTNDDPAFHVDRRLRIQMDALLPDDKAELGRALISREAFAEFLASRKSVDMGGPAGPHRAVAFRGDLLLIYRVDGDAIRVVDLLNRAAFQHFATRGRP